ncbi:hypothetical protein CBS101457_003044 [Exobasidium rhododendri]|nr:hypothetical protein CBS101457_003044 [Exobasidium rhododendri]
MQERAIPGISICAAVNKPYPAMITRLALHKDPTPGQVKYWSGSNNEGGPHDFAVETVPTPEGAFVMIHQNVVGNFYYSLDLADPTANNGGTFNRLYQLQGPATCQIDSHWIIKGAVVSGHA